MDKFDSRGILNVHKHSAQPDHRALICVDPEELSHRLGEEPAGWGMQAFSAGWHPWDIPATGLSEKQIGALEEALRSPRILAIGETGIDKLRLSDGPDQSGGAPLYAQINAFRTHLELAIRYRKPLILHAVRAQDIIIPVIKEYRERYAAAGYFPKIAIHGFRGKPTIAADYLRAGCELSFGERFNSDTLRAVPAERILAETDESSMPIEEIVARMREVRPELTEELIYANTAAFLEGGG